MILIVPLSTITLLSQSADLCSENKDPDQLPGYHTADLRLCFHICKNAGFLMSRIVRKHVFCIYM